MSKAEWAKLGGKNYCCSYCDHHRFEEWSQSIHSQLSKTDWKVADKAFPYLES